MVFLWTSVILLVGISIAELFARIRTGDGPPSDQASARLNPVNKDLKEASEALS